MPGMQLICCLAACQLAAVQPATTLAASTLVIFADQLIGEGTFVVTANTFGPQQVNVVLTNKKGYQKGKTSLRYSLDRLQQPRMATGLP